MTTGDVRNTTLIPLSTNDLSACLALAADREWPHEDRKWDFLLRVGQGYGLTDQSGGLVASAILTRTGDLAAISMVLVAARFEGRGLGTRLMRHVIAEAGTATPHLYATPLGKPLYEKLGFHSVAEADIRVGVLDAERSGRTRPACPADLPAILALDREVFGADRSGVLSGLFDFADHVRVVESDDRITAYAGTWRAGADAPTAIIGPLIAPDDDAARALVADLAADAGGPIRVDAATTHPDLGRWVTERGLSPTFHTDIMSLGGRPFPGDRRRAYLPFMQALG
ncbi:GNAT family N-acetyltransferase [Actinokineospora auranticolor]|uniref:Acetyltransferase (GNAT) family protein n=1 Tax=Actinokineospora auranticolor TaxID=155976 RepID=A0A2S6GH59_9PSEU|nr:GNAT family N-acetyltransferase [Actinokineospora auranticolor]PPK64562.1 acetyltransferase (GNAT) family protein [Actinokineospora auranticolor]